MKKNLSKNEIGEKIIKIIMETLPEKIESDISYEAPHDITLETTIDELNLSSIDFIKIIVEMEEVFDLEFDNEMLLFEAFTDISSISEYIIRKQLN